MSFKSFRPNFQKLLAKECQKITKNSIFLKFRQTLLFGRVPYLQILVNDDDFYATYTTEQGPLYLNNLSISSYLDNITGN